MFIFQNALIQFEEGMELYAQTCVCVYRKIDNKIIQVKGEI